MAKEKVEISIEYNYKMIAIASSLKDYRVSYLINDALNINLKKVESLVIDNKTKSKVSVFDMQSDLETNKEKEFYLISNKIVGNYFLSSLKSFDFIFIIKDERQIENTEELYLKFKEINKFQIVLKIEKLSKRENKIVEDNLIYFKKENKNLNENTK